MKKIIEYRGVKYRRVKGHCSECVIPDEKCIGFLGGNCGPIGHCLAAWAPSKTLRSRLATWWRGWVKRHIIDDYPYPGEM